MRTATLNIAGGRRVSRRLERIRRCMSILAGLCDLIGWQEFHDNVAGAVQETLGEAWETLRFAGASSSLAISWRTDRWEHIAHGQEQLHGGRRKVTPARFVIWVILRHRRTGKVVLRWNTHLISGGWSKGWRPTTRWRRNRWYDSTAVLAALIMSGFNGAVDEHHVDYVIGGGDTNRSRVKFLGRLVEYDVDLEKAATHGRKLYDYLTHVTARGLRVQKATTIHTRRSHANPAARRVLGIVDGFFDHAAVIVRYWWDDPAPTTRPNPTPSRRNP